MKELELAETIHGHRAPGVVLGVRMGKIAYEHLDTDIRGKGLTGIVETKVCLPDALMAVAGTTPGNMNLIVYDIGKLAITLARFETREGYRVALRSEAAKLDEDLESFMHRKGKLPHEAKDKLVEMFLEMSREWFRVDKVKLTLPLRSEKRPILECVSCGELQPQGYMIDGKCRICADEGYFEILRLY